MFNIKIIKRNGVTCPYFASGLCERTYCHFRHVKPDSNTHDDSEPTGINNEAQDREGSMLGMVSGAIKQVQREMPAPQSSSVFQKLESVKWYKPTPIPKKGQSRHKQSNKNQNVPEYNPTPLHVLKKTQTPVQDSQSPPIIPQEKLQKQLNSDKIKQEKRQRESDSESGYEPELDKRNTSVPAYKPTPRISPPTVQKAIRSEEQNQSDFIKQPGDDHLSKVISDAATAPPKLHEADSHDKRSDASDEVETIPENVKSDKQMHANKTVTDDDIISENIRQNQTNIDKTDDTLTCDNDDISKKEKQQETQETDHNNTHDSINSKEFNGKIKGEPSIDSKPGTKDIESLNTEKDDQKTDSSSIQKSDKTDGVKVLLENVVIKQEKIDVILIESGSEGSNKGSKSRKSSKKKSKHSSRDKEKDHKSRSRHKSSTSHSKDKKSSKRHSSRSKSSHSSRKKRKHDRKRSTSSSSSYSSSSSSSSSSRSRSRRRHSSSSHRSKRRKHSGKSKSSRSHSSRSKHKRRRHSSSSSYSSRSRSRSREKHRRSDKRKHEKSTVVQGYIKSIRTDAAKTANSSTENGKSENKDKHIFDTFAAESKNKVIKTEKPDSPQNHLVEQSNVPVESPKQSNASKSIKENAANSKSKSPNSSSQKKVKPVYKKALSCADLFGEESDSDNKASSAKIKNKPVSENKVTSTQNENMSKNKTAESATKKGHIRLALLKEHESDSESVVLSASDDDTSEMNISDLKAKPHQEDEDLDKSLEIPDSVLADLENEMSEEDPFDECYQIFNEAKSKAAHAAVKREKEMKKQREKKEKEAKEEEEAKVSSKVRVARGNEATARSSLQQRIANARLGEAQPSPAQVLHNRLLSQQQRSERKRSMESQQTVSSSLEAKRQRMAHTPGSSSSGNSLQAQLKNRQAHAGGKRQPTQCGTISKFLSKGTKREAHVSSEKKSIPRPTVPAEFGAKIPTNVRQVYLNKMIDECLKIYPEETSAYDRALAEEKEAYNRAGNKKIYLNVAVNCIKKLRNEATPTSVTSPTKNPRGMSHETLLGGAKALKTHFTVKRSSAHLNVNRELTVSDFYDRLRTYILTEEQQVENGYPRPDPDHPKQIKIFTDDEKTKNKISPNKFERLCVRCAKRFPVDINGELVSRETCIFHWGKSWKRRITKGVFENKWTCCGGDAGAKGCHVGNAHVHEQNKYDDRKGYVRMLESSTTPLDGNYGVYALDCEMVYTTIGNEIARVTVVDMKGESVLEQLILPSHPVTDYNTRFSGISEKDMVNVGISLRDVQAMLMGLFNKKTILLGHSLESDLIALKIVHDNVVDTSVVFPHRLGKPYKRALKTLMAEILQRIIQEDVGGHDSLEDAVSCMDLMKWKIKEDIKKEIRQIHSAKS